MLSTSIIFFALEVAETHQRDAPQRSCVCDPTHEKHRELPKGRQIADGVSALLC